MNRIHRFAALAALMTLLPACGAKGALFLPEQPAQTEEVPAADALPEAPATDTPAVEDVTATDVPADQPVDGNG